MKKLYVGNLPYSATEDEIRDLFSQYGELESVNLIIDRETGRIKGFGFVEYKNQADAENAINALNEKDLGGRALNVNMAKPRESGGSRGGDRRW
ncbi:MAG: RNA-binding protein [Gammaproteobacteria bacterium]|nr:RNA-binding protein [Gammaproteobacteria bacterium]